MNAISLANAQNSLVRQILNITDIEVLNKVEQVLNAMNPVTFSVIGNSHTTEKSRKEYLKDWEDVCVQIRDAREGKLKGRSVEELINEL